MSDRTELFKLHDWDELLFGGFYCLHCTPDDEDNFDEPIAWPCPPLREAGVTDDEARALIVAHREKVAAEHQAKKAADLAELQCRVDAFNARYPVGTPVFAYPGCRPEDDRKATRLVTRTRSKATVLSGHTDVVWVDGHRACIALTHVDPVSEDVWEGTREAEKPAEPKASPASARLSPEREAEIAELRARVAELEVGREKLLRWHREDHEQITKLVAQRERRRARLVALQNDALNMRGSLAPAGGQRKVPFELGETLTPAVDWLIARVAELERPAIEAKRNEIRSSYTEIIAEARETRDYEGAFEVECRLRDREEQWKREDEERVR
ncbi:hypothetical protein ACF1BS_03715 [Streptomyces sp. NPDC014748]|uniref:hypothetical protein n=1 Tax=Streptomyces sp. NPDC014748 TaxID=3364905 RepID=UPI0036FBA96E